MPLLQVLSDGTFAETKLRADRTGGGARHVQLHERIDGVTCRGLSTHADARSPKLECHRASIDTEHLAQLVDGRAVFVLLAHAGCLFRRQALLRLTKAAYALRVIGVALTDGVECFIID